MDVPYAQIQASKSGQPLGGKEMPFPTGGLSSVIDSSNFGSNFSCASLNVILNSPYNSDFCGGTRPGLKSFSGTAPSSKDRYRWLWPNGDTIMWNDSDAIAFSEIGAEITMPDGSILVRQHESFSVSASKGSIPSDLSVMAMYRDRMVVAKDTMWYASRIGAKDDFDYGSGEMDDTSRAVAGNVALAGRKGEEITALAAIRDKFLVVATKRSLWRIDGDPTMACSLVSESVGIVSRDAWCWDGTIFWFMGANGLYAMAHGEPPVCVTQHVEDRMSGMSAAILVYDVERKGIHIFGTKDNAASDWFYDMANKAAWPLSYPAAIRPTGGGNALMDGKNKIVFLCTDGAWRYWDNAQTSDDGTAIVSALSLGPVTHTTGDTGWGFLGELDCESGTGAFNLSGIVGKTSHEAITNAKTAVAGLTSGSTTLTGEVFKYSVTDGWNAVVRPRVRCNSFSAVVWSVSGRWTLSKVTAVHRPCGRMR